MTSHVLYQIYTTFRHEYIDIDSTKKNQHIRYLWTLFHKLTHKYSLTLRRSNWRQSWYDTKASKLKIEPNFGKSIGNTHIWMCRRECFFLLLLLLFSIRLFCLQYIKFYVLRLKAMGSICIKHIYFKFYWHIK